jgi:hydroxybutyrate-dimer hydrolase
VYGAIALAGPWALARGCAVVYTDKGAGSGWFDVASGEGAGLDGTLSGQEQAEFAWRGDSDEPLIAFKHAHSGDHPEAQWGLHVQQAAQFALQVLNEQRGEDEAVYDAATTRVLAVGVSNGAGAVLRAAELDSDLFDGVVAISPNILPGSGGRALLDYASEAALLMPCALADARFDGFEFARPAGAVPPASALRCASLQEAGLLKSGDLKAQAAEAYEQLIAAGWTGEALQAAALSTVFDLWRAVGAAYASAYARSAPGTMPCGYRYAMLDEKGKPRASSREERALWWSDTAGVPPAAGVGLLDTQARGADAALPALQCVRHLAVGENPDGLASTIRKAVEATRARLPRAGLPVVLMHGTHDGLIPEAFSSGPYSAWLRENDRPHTYWRLDHAQHFDAFLGLPPLTRRYLPLLPYAWRGMDALWDHLQDGSPLPKSATIRGRPRAIVEGLPEPLGPVHLAFPVD